MNTLKPSTDSDSDKDLFEEYSGDGIYLYINGKKHIDCASGTFNLSLGYSTKEITDALHKQLDRNSHLSSSYTKKQSAQVFNALKEFLPEHITSYWFRDITGSSANECALRIAHKATGKSGVVSLFLSHHGQSITTTSISGNAFRLQNFPIPVCNSLKIPAPDCNNCFYKQQPTSCGTLCARTLEQFIEYASNGQIAALIIEPILGNGGNIVPTEEYFRIIREICDRYGILIIADEVQTGFGRTGSFFASTGFAKALKPDIITFAKGAGGIGIPVAGVLTRANLNVLEAWEHSSTSGANPLSLVAMEEVIKYIKKNQILKNVQQQSIYLKKGLVQLAEKYQSVNNVRGKGLMLAFDLPSNTDVASFIKIAQENQLIVRGSRYGFGNTVKIRPPLIITHAEVQETIRQLDCALAQYESIKTTLERTVKHAERTSSQAVEITSNFFN
ncbi:aspartate aminotransferase family protein [Catenovulum sediminis]|uniref:Aspartate aminotransferase family protein n=1 Tax=Catenovulum sediminis TaxID=1740262 RepID=A0ABV1RLQ5_9ALTE